MEKKNEPVREETETLAVPPAAEEGGPHADEGHGLHVHTGLRAGRGGARFELAHYDWDTEE